MNSESADRILDIQLGSGKDHGHRPISGEKVEQHFEYRLSNLALVHIDNVVAIHLKGFRNFFLTFLGPRFLREFYTGFLADPQGIGFVAQRLNLEIVGVVVGSLNPNSYFKRLLKRRWWNFCVASTGAVLRRPLCVPRLIRAFFYRGEMPPGQARALLSSVVVSPELQGKGVGKTLVERWMKEAHLRGAKGCYLTTDGHGNEAANAFYQDLGWQMESSFVTREGRQMNRYIYDF